MIRDTFEANPGLCELFKRKILDRAQSVGFSKDMIDFESRIDMKGTFQDNLRTFYREYPQLAEDSDYFRLKSQRPLTGVVLEQSWRSYERNNGRKEPQEGMIVPELTVTYTVSRGPPAPQDEKTKTPDATSGNEILRKTEMNQTPSTHSELMRLLLDHVTALAGEDFTKTILHQIGREIGRAAYHHSNQSRTGNLMAGLDLALKVRGLGRVVDLEENDHQSKVTYVCTIEECNLCRNGVATTSRCSVMRGIVTRWLESHLGKKAVSTEGNCVDAGSHLCVFRVMFRKSNVISLHPNS